MRGLAIGNLLGPPRNTIEMSHQHHGGGPAHHKVLFRAAVHHAEWTVVLAPVPDDIYINRPSEPGVREALKTFAPGTRLDLCHNVPNQPGGGGVILPLAKDMTFFQVRGSVSMPVYKQHHPKD